METIGDLNDAFVRMEHQRVRDGRKDGETHTLVQHLTPYLSVSQGQVTTSRLPEMSNALSHRQHPRPSRLGHSGW